MNRITWLSIAAAVLFAAGAVLLAPGSWLSFAAAQEEPETEERADALRTDAARAEQLERRLDEIAELTERAEQRGNDQQVRQLREEAEQLLDQWEEIERRREDEPERGDAEEWERHERELGIHRLELEVQRLELELNAVRQESAVRLAHIASDNATSISYAVSQAIDQLGPEEAVSFLVEMREATQNRTIQRIIRHHLVILNRHTDQPDEVKRELRALILGP